MFSTCTWRSLVVQVVVVKLVCTYCYSTHKTSLIDVSCPPTDGLLHYRTLKVVECPRRSDSPPHLAFYIYMLSWQAPLVDKMHAHNCAPSDCWHCFSSWRSWFLSSTRSKTICRWHSTSALIDSTRGINEEPVSSSCCFWRWRARRRPPLLLLLAVLLEAGACDASTAPALLLRRCNEEWRIWWASASSQKYKRYDGRPFRNNARLCKARGGRWLRPPMFSLVMVLFSLSSACCSLDGVKEDDAPSLLACPYCASLPPLPWPLCSHKDYTE